MAVETVTVTSSPYEQRRRWMRYKLDVPIRAIVHKTEKTIIAEGRGTDIRFDIFRCGNCERISSVRQTSYCNKMNSVP